MGRFPTKTVVVGVVVLGCGAFAAIKVWPRANAPAKDVAATKKEKGKGSSASAPLRVSAVTIVPGPLAEVISSTGTLRAEEGVELQAEVNGKIVSVHIVEGARVRKGDLLVKLNDADLRATLQRAAWRKELAELKERRLARLLESASVKQEDYDSALNEVNVQRAEVALTEAQIAKTEIRAPFDGVVGLRFVSEGAFVNATTRVATLQNLDRIKIDFSVPERYAGRVPKAAPIAFTVPGMEQKVIGTIIAIEPRIDTGTRTLQLRAVAANPDGRLLPGGFANIELTLSSIPDAIQVPAAAVVPGVNDKNVFVIVNGAAVRRTVQTGTRSQTAVHILDGLKPGDVVITSGLQQMRAGLPVVVADLAVPAAALAVAGGKKKPADATTTGASAKAD
ncbi:efflux RND transporter periplasmic adaptor subunit [Horticoccus sp. 23ND18S-11]|uniref:efflux RND transporter periplasmic adaptor subunit n=1 Tax=Horticoccus sp. 23ND18S-11 TaxID=3391832 RepID=UPI0039C8CD09